MALLLSLFIGGSLFAQIPTLPAAIQSAKLWPGGTAGTGAEVDLAPQDGSFDGDVENLVQGNVDLRDFPAGSYRIPIRVKDAAGVEGNIFYVDAVVFEPKWESSIAAVDADNDGLPDQWETGYFGNLNAKSGEDSDGDGLTNLEELRLGSDPMSSLSPSNRVRQAEFFVGLDPGEGKGIPVPAKDGMLESDLEDLELPDFLTQSLPPGAHLAGLRVQRETGEWSNLRQIDIMVFEDAAPPLPEDFGIIEAEGFWEDRVSPGAGNPLALDTAVADRDVRDTSSGAQILSTGQLPDTAAKLFVRFKSGRTGFGEPLEITTQVQTPDAGTETKPLFVDSLFGVSNDPLFGSLIKSAQYSLRNPEWFGDAPVPLLGWIGTGDVNAYGTGSSLTLSLINGGTLTWLWGNGTYAVSFQDDQGAGTGKGALPRYTMATSTVPSIVHLSENTRLRCVGWQATGAAPASGTSNTATYLLTQDTNIRWLWITQHRVSMISRHGEVDGWQEWYDQGTSTALVPRPDPGYAFEGWAGALTGNATPGIASVPAPASITANFRPTEAVKLKVVEIDGTSSTVEYIRGATVDLEPKILKKETGKTRDIAGGWRVEGSIYDSGAGARVTVSLTRDTTVYWLPTRQYKLEPVIIPAGSGTVQISGRQSTGEAAWYDAGAIRLRALPANGNRFVEWYLQKWTEADVQTILSGELPLVVRFAKVEPLGDFAFVDGGNLTSSLLNSAVSHFRSFIPSAKMKRTEVTTAEYSKYLNWALAAGYIETPNHISVRGDNPLAEPQQGLKAEWFKGEDWTIEPNFRNVVETLNVDFGSGGAVSTPYGTPACTFTETDFFSFRLRGQILSDRTGKISLREITNDKVKIVFRGSVVLDNTDPNTNAAVQVDAVQGWNDVELIFVELTGTASFRIQWDPLGGTAWQDVPASRLRHRAVSTERQALIAQYQTSTFRDGLELVDLDTPNCNIEFVSGIYRPKTGLEAHPIVDVTWIGADAYSQWLAEATGQPAALPDEWLWEYAASGGNSTITGKYYPWGIQFFGANYTNANYLGSSTTAQTDIYNGTSPVGIFPLYQNLRDMAGNVWEWTSTLYEQGDPIAPFRVLRGGSWKQPVDTLATAYRGLYKDENFSDQAIGFRPALVGKTNFGVWGYLDVPLTPAISSPNSGRSDYSSPVSKYLLKALEVSNQEYADFLNFAQTASLVASSGNWVVATAGSENGKKLLELNSNTGLQQVGGVFSSKPGEETHPATNVTWHGAKAYCEYLGQSNPAARFDLPTQWQWENAMLRGAASLDMAKVNFSNTGTGVSSVGRLGSDVGYQNGFWPGFYDAAGNVQEWTSSLPALGMNASRVIRGGAFNTEILFVDLTKADQFAGQEVARPNLGFRPAVVALAPQIIGLSDKVVLPVSGSSRRLTFEGRSWLNSPTWTWTTVEAPAWATITNLGSGRIQATLTPPATAQTANLTLSVTDGSGLESRVTVPISIQTGGGLQIEDLPASVHSPKGQGNSTFFIRAVAISSNASNSTWSLSGDGGFATIEAAGDSIAKITVLPGSSISRNVTVTATSGNLTGTAVFSIKPEILPLRFVDFPESIAFRDNRTTLSIPLLAEGGSVDGQMTWSIAATPSGWARISWQEGRSAVLEVDRNGFATSASANITVTDGVTTVTRPVLLQEANQSPTLLLPGSAFAFNASSRPARVLLTAEDRNAADLLTWTIQPSGGKVSVVSVNNRSAELVVDASQPFAASNFTVRVSDGNLSTSANLSVSVTNTAPVLSGPEGTQEFQVGSGIREMIFSAIDPDKNQPQILSVSGTGSWLSWRYNGPASILVSVDTSAAAEGVLTFNATDGLASATRQVPVVVKLLNGSPTLGGLPANLTLKRFSPQVALPFTISDNDAADVHTVKLAFEVPGVRVELGTGERAGRILIDPIQGQDAVPIIFELNDGKETVRSALQLTLAAESPDSHQIVLAEYFFNTEPAPGSGVVIPASNNEPFNDTAFYERLAGIYGSLPIGWNRVGMRFKTAAGQWSTTAWRSLYIFEDAPRTGTAFVRPDGSVAYSGNNDFTAVGTNAMGAAWGSQFVDADPRLQGLPDQNLVLENNTGVEHLENAIVWAEYFIDTDPGVGNGITLPMDRRILDSTAPVFEFGLDSSLLPVGAHEIGLRLRMADGTWGVTRTITFHVFEDVELPIPQKAEVNDSEHTWNADVSAGFGYGINLENSTKGTEIGQVNNSVQTAPLDLGDQGLFLKFKTNANDWGNSIRYDLTVTAPDTSLNLVNLHVESNFGIPMSNYDTPQLLGSVISLNVPIVFNFNGLNFASFGYIGQGSAPSFGLENFVTFTIQQASDVTWLWGRDCEVTSRSDFGIVSGPTGWDWYAEFSAGYGVFPPVDPITLSVPPFVSVATGTRQFCTGWSGSGSAPASGKVNEVAFSPLAKNSEVNWTWRKEHLLTVATVGEGQVYGNFGWIQEGATANLLAVANPGHQFVRWEVANSGNSTSASVAMTEPKTIQAVFTKHRVWSVEPVTLERKLVGVYDSGAQASVNVPTFHDIDLGSRFVVTGWNLFGNQTNSGSGQTASFTVNSDSEVRWSGVEQHLVEKRVNALGSINVTGARTATDGEWFDEGVVGISAVSSNSSVFVEWLNELSGAPGSVQLRLESPLIADAVFRTRDSTFRAVSVPAGVIKNSPNSTQPDFNEMIAPFEIGESEVTNNQFTVELNAAIAEKSARVDSNMVYSRKELPLYYDGLSVEWLSSNNSVLRRERVANLSQPLAHPGDLSSATKGILNGQLYVGAKHLSRNLVLSGTGNATVKWNGQPYSGSFPISIPMGVMGWNDLQMEFAAPASSLSGITMGSVGQTENPFSSSLARYLDPTGLEPLMFYLGKIGASPNEQLDFQQAAVNLGSHTQNPATSDYGFAECGGDFDLIATVSRPSSGIVGLAARDGILAVTPELSLAVGSTGTLLINNLPTTNIVRDSWTLGLSRRGDTFAAEFLDLDGKWKDAKTGTLSLTAHRVTSLKGAQPCLAGVFVNQTTASFTGISLSNLANNFSFNNLLILDMNWPGSGITFNGTSFQSATGGTSPVTCVTYHGAKIFANWKEERRQDGDYDLPSEWEHEYLAGGKLGKSYPWDAASTGFANLEGSEPLFNGNTLSPVATFAPIEGIYDLAGNAWEWTNSDQLAGNSLWKTIRGGSFRSPLSLASSSFRLFYGRDSFVSSEVGFRVVKRPSAVASPSRLLTGNNLSLDSVIQGNIRGFNNPLSEFEISTSEVSNADFCAFLNDINNLNKITVVSGQVILSGNNKILLQLNGNAGVQIVGNQFTPIAGREGFPISNVTWHGADEFSKWLTSKNDVWTFRLPTESEWEASAKAGYNASQEALLGYLAGNVWSTSSRIFGDSGNQWRVNSLLGEVAEWTASQATGIPDMMIVRGGARFLLSSHVDAEDRSQYLLSDSSDSNLGFRLARVAKTPWKVSSESGSFSAKFDSSSVDEGGNVNLIVSRTGDPVFASNFSINTSDSRIQLPLSPKFAAGESVKSYTINVTSDTTSQGISHPTVTLLSESGEQLDLRFTVVDRSLTSAPTFESEYSKWLSEFPSMPTAKRGIADDADGDGLPNFAEFALYRKPYLSVGDENAQVSMSDGQIHLTFKRRKNISSIGLSISVLMTESIGGSWQSYSGPEQIIQEDLQSETLKISILSQGKSKMFFRVTVVKQ